MKHLLLVTVAVIALAVGSARADDSEGDKWVEQLGAAGKSCAALFERKFGETKGHDFTDCMWDQTNKATEGCIGGRSRREFSICVAGRTLKVMQACDLSKC
jgi:hypothetical protein